MFARDLPFGALVAVCLGATGLGNRSDWSGISISSPIGLTGLSERSDWSDSAELLFGEFSRIASVSLPRAFCLEIASP